MEVFWSRVGHSKSRTRGGLRIKLIWRVLASVGEALGLIISKKEAGDKTREYNKEVSGMFSVRNGGGGSATG